MGVKRVQSTMASNAHKRGGLGAVVLWGFGICQRVSTRDAVKEVAKVASLRDARHNHGVGSGVDSGQAETSAKDVWMLCR